MKAVLLFQPKLHQAVNLMTRIINKVVPVLVLFLFCLALVGVFSRELAIATPWVEELVIFTLAGIAMLGLPLAQKTRSHLRIVSFVRRFSISTQRKIIIVSEIATVVGMLFLVATGITFVRKSLDISTTTLPGLYVGYFYLVFPIGPALMGLYTLDFILGLLISPENIEKWFKGE